MSSELIAYSDLQRMAQQVVASKLFPVKSEAEAITLFLLCQADGLHPMRALRMFDIIQGRPAIKPKALMASLAERGGHVEWMQNDDQACIGKFYGKACPDGVVVKFDVEDAKKAGLLNKPGPWQQYRADMLRHRCSGRGVDMADPGAAFGLYSTPVVQDFEPNKQIDAEVVEGEPVNAVSGDSTAPAPSTIDKLPVMKVNASGTGVEFPIFEDNVRAANGLNTDEYLADVASKRAETLEKFLPKPPKVDEPEPFDTAIARIKAEVARKSGRPKSVPEFCPKCEACVVSFDKEEAGKVMQYWECTNRHRDRNLMKEQGESKSTIQEMPTVKDHFFAWKGNKGA